MLSIIIPAKNEEQIIQSTLEKIIEEIKSIDYEIIVIDDFSNDDTEKIVKSFQNKSEKVKYFKNKKSGLGPLVEYGVEVAKGEFIAIMMADLSDDLDDLRKYYENIANSDFDAVLGSRFLKDSIVIDYPKLKLFLNRFFNYFVKLIFLSDYNDFTNAFKIYRRKTLLNLHPFVSESFNIFLELPLKIISRNYNYKIIPIKWHNRKAGKSKFKIKELGAKYIFTLIYCFAEKILLKK